MTKRNCYDKPTELTLRHSLLDMKDRCKELGVKSLAMPRIGCGLDGLKWPAVYRMLCEIFCDCGIDITVYSIPDIKSRTSERCLEKPHALYDFARSKSPSLHDVPSKQKLLSDSLEEEEQELKTEKYTNFSKEEESPSLQMRKKYSDIHDKKTGTQNKQETRYSASSEADSGNLMGSRSKYFSVLSVKETKTHKALKCMKSNQYSEEEIETLRTSKRNKCSDLSAEEIKAPKKEKSMNYSESFEKETQKRRKRKNYSDGSEDEEIVVQKRKKSKSYSSESEYEEKTSRKRRKSKTYSDASLEETETRKKKRQKHSDASEEESDTRKKRKHKKKHSKYSKEEILTQKKKKHKNQTDICEDDGEISKKRRKDDKKTSSALDFISSHNAFSSTKVSNASETVEMDSKQSHHNLFSKARETSIDDHESLSHQSDESLLALSDELKNSSRNSSTHVRKDKRILWNPDFETEIPNDSHQSPPSYRYSKSFLTDSVNSDNHSLLLSQGKRKFSTRIHQENPKENEVSEISLRVGSAPDNLYESQKRLKTEKSLLKHLSIRRRLSSKAVEDEDSKYLKTTVGSKFVALPASKKTCIITQMIEEVTSAESVCEEDHLPGSSFLLGTTAMVKTEEESCYVSKRLGRSQISSKHVENSCVAESPQSWKSLRNCGSSDFAEKKGLSEKLKRRLGACVTDTIETRQALSLGKKGKNVYPALNISKKACGSLCTPIGTMYSDREKAPVSIKDRLSLGVRVK